MKINNEVDPSTYYLIINNTLQSALLPNAVKLHISEGTVSYSSQSNMVCLYRSDGNMYHLHRRAHHTHLRPPITVLTDQNDCKIFKVILFNEINIISLSAHNDLRSEY